MHLMVDFNQGLTLAEALQRCHMIDDYGLAWIEEPIVYDNLDGYAQLAAELKTPLQIGENFYGPREMHKALQKKACDLVMPDFMRIGGVTGWMRAARSPGPRAYPCRPISTRKSQLTSCASRRRRTGSNGRTGPIQCSRALCDQSGLLHIPDVPGVGLEWNEDAVAANLA